MTYRPESHTRLDGGGGGIGRVDTLAVGLDTGESQDFGSIATDDGGVVLQQLSKSVVSKGSENSY